MPWEGKVGEHDRIPGDPHKQGAAWSSLLRGLQQSTKEAPKHSRPFKPKPFFSLPASFPIPWDPSPGEGGSTNAEEFSRTFLKVARTNQDQLCIPDPPTPSSVSLRSCPYRQHLSLLLAPHARGHPGLARQATNTLHHGEEAQLGLLHQPALPVQQGHGPRAARATGQELRGWPRHEHCFICGFHTFHLQVVPKQPDLMIPHVSTQAPGYGEICTGVAVSHYKKEQLLALCTRASRVLWVLPLHHPLLQVLRAARVSLAPLNSPALPEGWHRELRLGMDSTSPHCSVWHLPSHSHPGCEKAQGE